jgi:5-methylcytosine-specific restriction endonuclease McrA
LFTRRRGNQVTCGDKECRRRYQNRQSSEWMMRRYREDPIFRDKMIAAAENRRADRLGAGNIRSPKALVTFLRARDNGTCGICGGQVTDTTGPMRPSIDHKIPLRPDAGPPGEHTLANVQLAHYRCNLRKGNRVSRELHFPAACELVVRAPRPRRTARNLARPGEP